MQEVWPFIDREVSRLKDIRHEPPFGLLGEVVFWGNSDWVCHNLSDRCTKDWPHLISECKEFDKRRDGFNP